MKEQNSELIYVACAFDGPTSTIRQHRIEVASKFCAHKMRQGVIVFCPLVHNYQILKYGLPIGWDYWEKFNSQLLQKCDRLFVLKIEGWEHSTGIQAEISLAREFLIPIEYHDIDDFSRESLLQIEGYC